MLCCGLPAASTGVLDTVRYVARENIKKLERENYESYVVDDSSCAAHLKDYPAYFDEDAEWQNGHRPWRGVFGSYPAF